MIEIYDKTRQLIPIKAWVDELSAIDDGSMNQAINLANLPMAFSHVALMPDCHAGFGMPIGGVIALDGQIIPNGVGVDIGCGIAFTQTNIMASSITPQVLQSLRRKLMSRIPMGADHRKKPFPSIFLKEFAAEEKNYNSKLMKELKDAHFQLGTLGGGNHFIEIQENQEGKLCLMVHSGSRHFGHTVATYFHKKARMESKTNDKDFKELAYFAVDSPSGRQYIKWMNAAMTFAKENRGLMMTIVIQSFAEVFKEIKRELSIDVHHNYASEELINGSYYWVHRKGAISAYEGQYGIIPSAMGGLSYLVKGKGNPESFYSCSHGAGRLMSRKQAIKTFSIEETQKILEDKGVLLGIKPHSIITDEDPRAYKDIGWVLSQESDLVEVVDWVKSLLVLKG